MWHRELRRRRFENPQPLIEKLAARMMELGVKPELEIFDLGHVANAMRLVKKRVSLNLRSISTLLWGFQEECRGQFIILYI